MSRIDRGYYQTVSPREGGGLDQWCEDDEYTKSLTRRLHQEGRSWLVFRGSIVCSEGVPTRIDTSF